MALFLLSSFSKLKNKTGCALLTDKIRFKNGLKLNKCKNSEGQAFLQPQSNLSPVLKKGGKDYSYKIGQKIKGFLVKEIESVPEFQLIAIKLIHEATGGQYLHIKRDDSNNAFAVMFRTTPTDSTGLPHILEHTTLCGSRKYPCRDPFFKMLNRSLATYMNALTAPDYTMYPFSTQNPKDFENLMSVYLDAVFSPQLKELDFHQEGWRLEHENPEDKNTPIILKGVVYNEMKGVFADNQNIFEYALLSNLLPSNTYGVCSGGDPSVIPNLTHEDLKNFHKKYYSFFNAKYYSYGNFPLEKHIEYLSVNYLEKMKVDPSNKIATVVPPEERWNEPVRKHIKCRVDPMVADKNKQSSIAISVLCSSITNVKECFLLKVLAQLLVGGPNSAFYKTLIEPNIGAGFSPVTGFESQTRDTFFTVGLQGVSEGDFDKIIKIYDDTIDDVIKNGFKKQFVEAVLHSIELNLKHQASDFGLGLLFSLAPIWNHEGEVINFMKVEDQMEKFKQNLELKPNFLQAAVQRYFKDNNHKLILTMSPDENYTEKEKQIEMEILQEKLENLTEEDKEKIYQNGLALLNMQSIKDDRECLPTLKISDLKQEVEKTEIIKKEVSGVNFYLIPQPTNGITYFRGLLPLSNMSDELSSLLPLFALVSTKMGTKKRNHKEFDQMVNLKTGGLDVGCHLKVDTNDANLAEESLIISSYCLNKNLNPMFDLWLEMFESMKLEDLELFETLVKDHAAGLVNGVTHMGHHYAMLSASSLVSSVYCIKERNSGLTYVNLMKQVAQGNFEEVLSALVKIQNKVMTKSRLRCAVNMLEGTEKMVLKSVAKFIENAPGNVEQSDAMKKVIMPFNTRGLFYVLPIPINYTSKAFMAVPYGHEDFPVLAVMTRLITMKYLHPLIREKGGAYGSGLNICSSGVLKFYSYRDPNPVTSHNVYDSTLSWLLEGKFSDEDVDEAKLGIFQSVDAPIPPGSRGMRWFLNGVTDEFMQQYRLRTMAVNKEQVIEIGKKYLSVNSQPEGRVVIGPENKTLINNSDQNWEVIEM